MSSTSPTSQMPPSMKQIAGLFNDCIETIRNENHGNLEQTAIDWLRDARYKLMRNIEAEYYKLAASVDNPTKQQSWALNPSDKLLICTIPHAAILRPYAKAIINNIQELMDACGFNSTVIAITGFSSDDYYAVQINFPDRLTNARNEHIPQTLRVNDAIDTAVASNFARLIKGEESSQLCAASKASTADASTYASIVDVRPPRRKNVARGFATIFGGLRGRGYTEKY